MRCPSWTLVGVALLALGIHHEARAAEPLPVTTLTTPDGIEFGILGKTPSAPAPTLFVFAQDFRTSLTSIDAGQLLAKRGFLCVSLDVPCHGKDNREAEKNALAGWRKRLERGEDLIPSFTAKCAKVLDHLIAEGYTDPKRVAACGQSRGGFIAMHVAAADPRIRCAAAFAPVTNLLALGEFKGMEGSEAVTSLALGRAADKLAGRPIWVCIGNKDRRVDTDEAIAFTRKVVDASVAQGKPARVELHVTPPVLKARPGSPLTEKEVAARLWKGHITHPTAHQDVAAWVTARMEDED